MEIKEIFNLAKEHPRLVFVCLFFCLVCGGFAGGLYVKLSEQRVDIGKERIALMEEKMKQLDETTKNQKRVNEIVQNQFSVLVKGVKNSPNTINTVKGSIKRVMARSDIESNVKQDLLLSVQKLEKESITVNSAIEKTDALINTFSKFLSAGVGRGAGLEV
jgi:hypothetical protein